MEILRGEEKKSYASRRKVLQNARSLGRIIRVDDLWWNRLFKINAIFSLVYFNTNQKNNQTTPWVWCLRLEHTRRFGNSELHFHHIIWIWGHWQRRRLQQLLVGQSVVHNRLDKKDMLKILYLPKLSKLTWTLRLIVILRPCLYQEKQRKKQENGFQHVAVPSFVSKLVPIWTRKKQVLRSKNYFIES